GAASTLSVASGAKAAMANILKTVTSDVQVKQFLDQSVFVKGAVSGVVREGRDRSGTDCADDTALPRRMEKHHHHRDIHSSVRSRVNRSAQRDRTNNQSDDTGWACSRRRYPSR